MTPLTLSESPYIKMESRSFRFHPFDFSSMSVFNISAPYNGGLKAMFFQNCIRNCFYHWFNLFDTFSVCDLIEIGSFLFVFFESHWLFWNVKALVNSTFPENVLLDGTVDNQVLKFFFVIVHSGDPLFGRYNLRISFKKRK